MLKRHANTSVNFNPRSREGSDGIVSLYFLIYNPIFQSTLPRGERLEHPSNVDVSKRISIHAPARGATGDLQLQINDIDISIHAPARGATTTPSGYAGVKIDISIHAPARGATVFPAGKDRQRNNFNPRSREGSDVFSARREIG